MISPPTLIIGSILMKGSIKDKCAPRNFGANEKDRGDDVITLQINVLLSLFEVRISCCGYLFFSNSFRNRLQKSSSASSTSQSSCHCCLTLASPSSAERSHSSFSNSSNSSSSSVTSTRDGFVAFSSNAGVFPLILP
uniref:AlNc14C141G7271 protein n=1 Tax=Albugo laibachii Nc14 TaxID=890382 RepID=F0WL83_9STRA|nr:AlNc14C141G7271 [Albugo laibachii Nc14]|eukprot:CCA22044.1 AlNc14C141G7271 [Albugo laibachii Nc14]